LLQHSAAAIGGPKRRRNETLINLETFAETSFPGLLTAVSQRNPVTRRGNIDDLSKVSQGVAWNRLVGPLNECLRSGRSVADRKARQHGGRGRIPRLRNKRRRRSQQQTMACRQGRDQSRLRDISISVLPALRISHHHESRRRRDCSRVR